MSKATTKTITVRKVVRFKPVLPARTLRSSFGRSEKIIMPAKYSVDVETLRCTETGKPSRINIEFVDVAKGYTTEIVVFYVDEFGSFAKAQDAANQTLALLDKALSRHAL